MLKIKRDEIKLNKLSLQQLNDILEREAKLLKNNKIINSLKDNGKSIKEFCTKLEKEIKFRKDEAKLEISINKLCISSNSNNLVDKHTKYLCEIEKINVQNGSSLLTIKNNSSKTKIKKNIQLITLSDSLNLLQEQADKFKKQQKIRQKTEFSSEESVSESDSDQD